MVVSLFTSMPGQQRGGCPGTGCGSKITFTERHTALASSAGCTIRSAHESFNFGGSDSFNYLSFDVREPVNLKSVILVNFILNGG